MAKLTPFGIALRKLRIEKELRLFDLAEAMQKSTALISAIETGRKTIPDGFVLEVARALDLNTAELRLLNSAKEQTRKEVKVEHLRGDQRELIAALARRLDDMPPSLIDELKKKVLKSAEGEIPFQRKRRGMLVSPMSAAAIESLAGKVRNVFCKMDRYDFPIIEVLEIKLQELEPRFVFDVRDGHEIDGDEGRVIPGEHLLILRTDVYDGACRHQARPRFTACHELGHYVMHHEATLSRATTNADPIYRDAEWQADMFAGALMLCRRHASELAGPDDAAAKCRMSPHAARVTYSKYER